MLEHERHLEYVSDTHLGFQSFLTKCACILYEYC